VTASTRPAGSASATEPSKTVIQTVLASALVLLAGGVGLLLGMPTLFPSLGPTAFVQVETPEQPAARPWNVLVGHLCGAVAGYLAVAVTGAGAMPSVLATAELSAQRVAAAVLAIALTMLAGALLRANHPPAAATTLLIALGGFAEIPNGPEALAIGVVVIALAGELARRLVLPADAPAEARGFGVPWAQPASRTSGAAPAPGGPPSG
jgi:CBS-domain-containing membrane protein